MWLSQVPSCLHYFIILIKGLQKKENLYTTPSYEKSRYETRAGQIFLSLPRFVENISNIYILI
jgi:hypothetical protein